MFNRYTYFLRKKTDEAFAATKWDFFALILVFGLLAVFTWAAHQMRTPYHIGQSLPITLSFKALPEYALLTVIRMFAAMTCSLIFTFIIGTLAAKSRRASQLIIPCIDILQSLPVMGLLSITVTGFIALFPGSRLGPECAAIFAIFTAQVWNMTLSFYQSLKTVPAEFKEAAEVFHLSVWQYFWRIEVPFATPGLLWNAMLSMSGSWIFLVATEAISVNNQTISLPGIGSYLSLAIQNADIHAVFYAIVTMLIVIFLYDQLLFRPLLQWAEKFKVEHVAGEMTTHSWVGDLLQRSYIFRFVAKLFTHFREKFIRLKLKKITSEPHGLLQKLNNPKVSRRIDFFWGLSLVFILFLASFSLIKFILTAVSLSECLDVFVLGFFTALRILVVILISTIIWVPVGVWIGLRPRIAEKIQPIVQFLAAFPANVLFPFAVMGILKFHLNVEIWVTPLILLGSQWYLLFNIISGASALPKDLLQVADNFGVKGWRWWQRLVLPGIFPYYVTGALTALGNAWNTSVIVEVLNWGTHTLTATGLGAYITKSTQLGSFPQVALGMGIMGIYVLLLNHVIWQPLYRRAEERYRLE